MTLEVYAAYLIAWTLIAIVPGPTVALIVSNSVTHGMRAGLPERAPARCWHAGTSAACPRQAASA